jgi:two-component system, OmpR family, sensor kinase
VRKTPLRNVRSRLLAIVLVALALSLAAATVIFNILFARTTDRDANALLRTRAASELSFVSEQNHRLRFLPNRNVDDDSLVWLFDGNTLVSGPPGPGRRAAQALVRDPTHRFSDLDRLDLRLYAAPVSLGGSNRGTLVTAISTAPYETTLKLALISSAAFALIVLLVVGTIVYFLLRSALRPVARMTTQAAAWSEHDLDRRFDLGAPHDELTQLAATLDGLLDRLAVSLRREQRFSAELSHELRTPLAKIVAETEYSLRRERDPSSYRAALAVVLRNAHQVARILDGLLAAARYEAQPQTSETDAWGVAEDAIDAVATIALERGVQLTGSPPMAPLTLSVDADLAERVLQPVLENACRYGRSNVRVSAHRDGASVAYRVEDDGPGVTTSELEAIFEPGTRGRAGRSANGHSGAGLGLALARRLARTASGDILARAERGGCFIISLPAAQ